jgi:hypothetical protein
MKWYGITGSWRLTNKTIENDVRKKVSGIIKSGNGIVTGGALNVDYFALDEALKLNPKANQIKVFLPVTLPRYAEHYKKRAKEGVITQSQAEDLIPQLIALQKANPMALIENFQNTVVDTATYFERDIDVVNASDELYAFQVNNSSGTQDTIDKAKKKGIPVRIFAYRIE